MPPQELFQTEGDRDFSRCIEALATLCAEMKIPVIAKEVGNGISRDCALQLQQAGVSAIDVGGHGGTSWVLVDSLRSGIDAGPFTDWGIPTAISIIECRNQLPLIATGGIRTGLDMAKAIALGADVCCIALPFLRILDKEGTDGVSNYVRQLRLDLKRTMFLTGCNDVAALRKASRILSPKLRRATGQS